ncbi:hypothetical protein L1049_000494 [Liquidambar formosana]|uniref:Uncharacterized protein n=1 Tax=Liquidambar formosana TaxID=63359 RepID=A0AAP0N9T9_LIQFO
MPDISPPRRVRRSPSYQDVLRASSGPDLSPPRKNRGDIGRPGSANISQQSHPYSIEDEVSDLSPPRKSRKELSSLKERPKTGLVTGQDIKEEISKTKKEYWLRFKGMDPWISGRGAEPVYRDKIKGQELIVIYYVFGQEKKLEWGKGLAQKWEAEARQQELELEKDKPFARTSTNVFKHNVCVYLFSDNLPIGYEKGLFKRMNEKQATEKEAYLWSVSDM